LFIADVKRSDSNRECVRFEKVESDNYSFVENQYFGCSSKGNGGALCIVNIAVNVSIMDCFLVNCDALNGGGLYFSVGTAVIVDSEFVAEIALLHGSSLWVSIDGLTPLHWSGLLVSRGVSRTGAFVLRGTSTKLRQSGAVAIDQSNFTENWAVEWACAGFYSSLLHFGLEYCAIERNHGTNGLLFENIETTSVRCLAIRSNTCVGTSSHEGLFTISRSFEGNESITICDSLIVGNSGNCLVGSGWFIFSNCCFDRFGFSAKGAALFDTLACELAWPGLSMAPDCGSRARSEAVTLTGRNGPIPLGAGMCARYNDSDDYVFSDVEYIGCSSTGDGGALFISHSVATASVTACSFINCKATGIGAGLYFSISGAVMVRSTFRNGSAPQFVDSIYVWLTGQMEVHWMEIAVILGSCPANVFELRGTSASSTFTLGQTNLTDHIVTDYAGLGNYKGWSHMKLEFSTFSRNTGPGGFFFSHELGRMDIRCIAVRSNNCTGTSSSSLDGLFRDIAPQIRLINDSLIVNNSATYLVGNSGYTFVNCFFDTWIMPGREIFETVNCRLIWTELSIAPVCVSGTENLPFSSKVAQSALFSSSLSIQTTRFLFLTKVDLTESLHVSHHNLLTA
jgi:hypothetical protein